MRERDRSDRSVIQIDSYSHSFHSPTVGVVGVGGVGTSGHPRRCLPLRQRTHGPQIFAPPPAVTHTPPVMLGGTTGKSQVIFFNQQQRFKGKKTPWT